MATAPTVQALDQIMAELQPSVQGQVDVINQQKAASAGIYDAQRAGLDAQKVKGFNDINTQATGRGMAFSGIPLNEQAEYLSTKYLPGIQAANAQQNMDALAYDRQAADLNANIFNRAFDWRNQQVLTLNDWNKMLAGQDFSRSEREAGQAWQSGENVLNRNFQTSERVAGQNWQTSERKDSQSFTAGENQKERDFTASQNAMSRAASAARSGGGASARASGALNAPTSGSEAARAFLLSNSDSQGKVNPSVWAAAVDMANRGGMGFGGSDGFASTFWSYANDDQWKKYKKGYEKYM